MASAIRFHPKARLTLRQFSMVTEGLRDMQITREPTHVEWRAALRLASENPISMYDAIYIGVTVLGGSKMMTSDMSLLTRLKSRQARENVLLLRDLAP